MVLWILLALMTGAAVMTVLWPLSRAVSLARQDGGDVTFYRDQLAEIARDEARGLMSGPEAEAARVEAGRRLIRATEAAPDPGAAMGEPALRRRRAASALALSVVPLVGLTIYGALGSPELPSRPLLSPATADARTTDVATALARIETHLAQAPDDRRGWELVAPIYLRLGRYDDAARAFQASIRLGADGPDQLTGYGEALVSAGGGIVSADARSAFEHALAKDPSSAKAQFYLALAAEQDGDASRAREGYSGIVAAAPADAPYLPVVRARLAGLESKPGAGTETGAAEMRPQIEAMVGGLDGRLMEKGGSEAEWMRLVRSLVVLGRKDDARERLGRAKVALAGDPGAAERLDGLARGLGLDGETRP
jgi:cytochrome c-type biogenesis protein CcmH